MTQKLSKKSLEILYNTLSPKAEKALKTIYQHDGVIQSTLMDITGMTYANTSRAVEELEHKLFIKRDKDGNAWPIRVTHNGEDVLQRFIYNKSPH